MKFTKYFLVRSIFILLCLLTLNAGAKSATPMDSIESKVNFFLSKNQLNDAIRYLTELIEASSENDRLYTILGNVYLKHQIFSESEKFFNKALDINSSNSNAIFGLAQVFFFTDRLKESKKLLLTLLKNEPNNIDVLNYLGQISITEKNLEAVKYYYSRILELDSTNTDALNNLAVIYLNTGEINKAKNYLLKSISIKPKNELAYYNLGIFYGLNGDLHDAITYFNKALDLNPNNSEIYYTLGSFYLLNQIFAEAERLFAKAIELNPSYIEPRIGLIIIYQDLNEFDKVREELKTIDLLYPDYPQLNLIKANYFYAMKDYKNAIESVLLEIKANPGNAESYYFLSNLYYLIGDEKKSLQAYNQGMEIQKSKSTEFQKFRDNGNPSLKGRSPWRPNILNINKHYSK